MSVSRSRLALGLASLLIAGCSRESGGDRGIRSERAKPAGPVPVTVSSATETWRLEIAGASPHGTARLPGGNIAVGWTLEGMAEIGGKSYRPRGESDVLVTIVGPDGSLRSVTQLGGPGSDSIEDIAASGDGVNVGFQADSDVTLAGKTLQTPSSTPNAFAPPYSVIVARVAGDGTIVSGYKAFDNRAHLQLASLSSGDIIATSNRSEERGDTTLVRRFGPDGELRWEKLLEGVWISHIQAESPDRAVASVAGGNRIGIWSIDAKTGDVIERRELEQSKFSAGDRGGIGGVVDAGAGKRCAYGETGGSVVLDGKEIARPSYAIQPFMLVMDAKGTSFLDVADVTGMIQGIGTAGDTPAAALRVIHTGSDARLHRGEYLVLGCAADRKLVPLFQYRHENDDWEHQPAQTVSGVEIHSNGAMFVDGGIVLTGRSGREPTSPGCIAKIALR